MWHPVIGMFRLEMCEPTVLEFDTVLLVQKDFARRFERYDPFHHPTSGKKKISGLICTDPAKFTILQFFLKNTFFFRGFTPSIDQRVSGFATNLSIDNMLFSTFLSLHIDYASVPIRLATPHLAQVIFIWFLRPFTYKA